MARVNVENGAIGDRRLDRLARCLGISRPAAMGHLIFLWEESQELLRSVGSSREIYAWFAGSDLPDGSDVVAALNLAGYVVPSGDAWEIVGNAKQIAGLIKHSAGSKLGGEATRLKFLKIREREGSPPSSPPSSPLAQCKAMQGNARQEGEPNKPDSASPPSPIGESPSLDLIKIWNENRGPLSEARATAKRREKIRARVRENDDPAYWHDVVTRLAKSSFATGKNDRAWQADFGWLIANGENHVKASEGKYDDRKATTATKRTTIETVPVLTAEELKRSLSGG